MYISHRFEPGNVLSAFLSGIYIINSPQEIIVNTLPQPDMSLTIISDGAVYLHDGRDHRKLPQAFVTTGYHTRRQYRLSAGASLTIINFRACALQSFFRLSGRKDIHDLSALLNEKEPDFLPSLQNTTADQERVLLAEAFLCRQFNAKHADAMMMSAAGHIQSAKGSVKISRLHETMYLSESQFEKRFRRSAGCSAKRYASLIRIHKVITGETEGVDVTDTAYEAGYFDQAHFIRDFKTYTGYTPKRFFKLQKEWGQVVPALGFVAP